MNYLIKRGVPSKMQECLAKVVAKASIKCGRVIYTNIVGIGVDIMASRELGHKRSCLERDENLK